MENLKDLMQFGNRKIPKRTAIFNMGSAFNCPSEKLGLCEVADICYAKKAESCYKNNVPQYRNRQTEYWMESNPSQFITEFVNSTKSKRVHRVDTLRLNEAGDFWSQECVDKAERIAEALRHRNVKVYTYTARKDLDFSKLKHLYVNGSGFWKEGINGVFTPVDEFSGTKGNLKCIADCKKCSLCYSNMKGRIIEVKKH